MAEDASQEKPAEAAGAQGNGEPAPPDPKIQELEKKLAEAEKNAAFGDEMRRRLVSLSGSNPDAYGRVIALLNGEPDEQPAAPASAEVKEQPTEEAAEGTANLERFRQLVREEIASALSTHLTPIKRDMMRTHYDAQYERLRAKYEPATVDRIWREKVAPALEAEPRLAKVPEATETLFKAAYFEEAVQKAKAEGEAQRREAEAKARKATLLPPRGVGVTRSQRPTEKRPLRRIITDAMAELASAEE